ncbi:MAG: homoserine kinase [Candidatus Marinimicrobia bacterium]|nr:homoserine kinase [Candidatus Neomarinimicrobiota bacterium]|tara:strand:- start:13270 stop:14226 length:957 start_codon:yes stop_codon:yes gene_type:complete
MAVYTKLSKKEIELFLQNYSIGTLNYFEEIVEGIENSNFKIVCNNMPYILTIFEKRVNEKDLPFFVDLKFYLNDNKFLCPRPVNDIKGNTINEIKSKKAIIVTFLDGEKIYYPTPDHCEKIGKVTADLHLISSNFQIKRKNSLGLDEWKKIFEKCKTKKIEKFINIFEYLENEMILLETNWPNQLPSGIIHADLFKDNVFFKNNHVSGIIDFYFSCFDFFIYDLAIIINDWCFDKKEKKLNKNLFKSFISGYLSKRKINNEELNSLNILCRAAAVRILVTRLHDYIFHPNNAIVVKKDPFEYYNILKWHKENNLLQDD